MPRAEVARQVRALHRVYATVGRVVYADAKRKREFSAIHHFDATNPDACALRVMEPDWSRQCA
jgi:hypothetical protein